MKFKNVNLTRLIMLSILSVKETITQIITYICAILEIIYFTSGMAFAGLPFYHNKTNLNKNK